MKKLDNQQYANIIIPKEMVPFENENCVGVKYYHKPQDDNEWETGLIFIDRKFIKQYDQFNYKVGIVKSWTYTAKTNMAKSINIPASNLIFFLMNERKKYGGK